MFQQYVCHIYNTLQDQDSAHKWYASEIRVTITDYINYRPRGKRNSERMLK
jgi:hypothetical protein